MTRSHDVVDKQPRIRRLLARYRDGDATSRPPVGLVQLTTVAASVLLLLLGGLGLLARVCSDGGYDAHVTFLGVLNTSLLMNFVHLVIGGVGLMLTARVESAHRFLVAAGAFYTLLGLAGVYSVNTDMPVATITSVAGEGMVKIYQVAPWLHLWLGAAIAIIGALAWVYRQNGAENSSPDQQAA